METEWQVGRLEARGRGGMVAAKTPQAAAAGAEVLRRGGNAVDAAVTTAFAAGVVEPWMNGIGGGGYMVVHVPGEAPAVVEYPMTAPAAARAEMFPLTGAKGEEAMFGWPAVEENANVFGYRSVAVPGTVAGLALALERWGTISLAEALAPAIRWRRRGSPSSGTPPSPWRATSVPCAASRPRPRSSSMTAETRLLPRSRTGPACCVRRIWPAPCARSPARVRE